MTRIYPRYSTIFAKQYFNKNKIKVIEIGTYKGDNAVSLIKELNIEELYLIDPYITETSESSGVNSKNISNAEKEAHNKIKNNKNLNVIWIKKSSSDCLKEIPDNIDYIYVDGNHTYEQVKADLENYYKKLKIGGIIAGHDFDNGGTNEKIHKGVILAVIEFIIKKNPRFIISSSEWIIIKTKNERMF